MKIVYISNLSGNKSQGLSYSIPEQIESQSKIDNVFWYNLNPKYKSDIGKNIKYGSIQQYPTGIVSHLPSPYDKPDMVVFEGFYFIIYCKIAKKLNKSNIPYIIIPRSSLTKEGQNKKKIKKKVGNFLFFKRFARNAAAIQYLTKAECISSGNQWNKKSIIIPNGINKQSETKVKYNENQLRGVFIGRLDIYQKGLDLLIKACEEIRGELIKANLSIDIYGPDEHGSLKTINDLISKNRLDNVITVNNPVFGSEKEKVILESDFFVLTSRFEGHPMGLIEALSFGMPSIVTQGTNMAEEIKQENAGWAAENNVKSISKAIKQLIREKDSLSYKGNNAIKISNKYDWDVLAEKSHMLYKQVIKKDNSSEYSI